MASLLGVLALLGACATGEKGQEVNGDVAACEEFLGEDALAWMKRQALPDDLLLESEADLDKTRAEFQRWMREWRPGDTPSAFPYAYVCSARKQDQRKWFHTLSYTQPPLWFDEIPSEVGSSGTRVNRDVWLTRKTDQRGLRFYYIYLRCQVPGAPPEQGRQLPVMGVLTDSLTGDKNPRLHYTHLLHSARVMVEALGCTNKPVVPAQPPASVK
ncbi:hypothetical protein [Streptomyces sp. enrichment culture]|uniref:hypothetical protein n=1 Tax=Streptomyces sp. enrichment culture TaxID=1795815 RepID=UPI003F55843F